MLEELNRYNLDEEANRHSIDDEVKIQNPVAINAKIARVVFTLN